MELGDGDSKMFATLERAACADPDVVFAVAFGSRIGDTSSTDSDLDLAIKFVDHLSESERFQKRCLLSGDLQMDEGPFIDVSDIEQLPPDVAHDVINGRLVCGDEDAFELYKAKVQTMFEDRRDELRRHQRTIIERIAEDGLRG